MKPGDAYTIGLSLAIAFDTQKDRWEGFTNVKSDGSAASIVFIIAWTTCLYISWMPLKDVKNTINLKPIKKAYKTAASRVIIQTFATSPGSWTSYPNNVSAVTGLGRVPFTSSFNRSFSVRSFSNCFLRVSNSAFFLHLVFRAKTLLRSLNNYIE